MAAKVGSGGDEGDEGTGASVSGVSVSGSDASGASASGSGASASSESLGYEQARDELIDVVRRLEAGGTTLEESLALWERGEALAKVCRRWLEGARARLDAALEAEG